MADKTTKRGIYLYLEGKEGAADIPYLSTAVEKTGPGSGNQY